MTPEQQFNEKFLDVLGWRRPASSEMKKFLQDSQVPENLLAGYRDLWLTPEKNGVTTPPNYLDVKNLPLLFTSMQQFFRQWSLRWEEHLGWRVMRQAGRGQRDLYSPSPNEAIMQYILADQDWSHGDPNRNHQKTRR